MKIRFSLIERFIWWAEGTTKFRTPDKILYPTYFTLDKSIYARVKCKNIHDFLVKNRQFVEKGVSTYINGFVVIDVSTWRIWIDGYDCVKTKIVGDIDEWINYFKR